LTPKSQNPTFKTVRPFDFQGYPKKFLFEHFRNVNIKDQESIIDFADTFGLLIGPEYIMCEQEKKINSISIDFFIREARDFQEILSLREHLSKSEDALKAYFDNYFEKRFKCDNDNFDSWDKNLARLEFFFSRDFEKREFDDFPWLWDKGTTQRLGDIHYSLRDGCGFLGEKQKKALREKWNIREDDPYYLNRDFSNFCKQNANYFVSNDKVTYLDFMDYPQKRNELSTKDLGYYYLEKWLKFKLSLKSRIDMPLSQNSSISIETEAPENTHKPQSLLNAIYLQFYYSLYDNPSPKFCPICLKDSTLDFRDDLAWHQCSKKAQLTFHYHEHCIRRLGEKLRRHKKKTGNGVLQTIIRAKEEGYLNPEVSAKMTIP
jgi:hypothetical protein